MRDADNIRDVEALSPDIMGFIFYPKSPRFVSEVPGYLPANVLRAGVFVDEEPAKAADTARLYGLDFVQLHGHESPEYCMEISRFLPKVEIIKAFHIFPDGKPLNVLTGEYEGLCRYYLFDTGSATMGGTGKTFGWKILQSYNGTTPFLLSGGIGPESLERLRTLRHPSFAGVDLNSRFETSPGVKDTDILDKFIEKFRQDMPGRNNRSADSLDDLHCCQ